MSDLNRKIALEDKARFKADSIARARKSLPMRTFLSVIDIFKDGFSMDSVCFLKDSAGIYYLAPVVRDTMFLGPELIIRDTLPVLEDSVAAVAPEPEKKSFRPVPDARKRIPADLKLLPSKKLIDK